MNPLDSLGINGWSLLLHLVNIFSLVIVLTFVLYKPLLGFMESRRKKITDSLEEIDMLKEEFNIKLDLMHKEKEELLADFHTQMSQGKKDLEEQKNRIIAEAHQTKEALITEAMAQMAKKKDQLVQDIQRDVLSAMESIVLTVLQEQMDKAAIQKSIADQWQKHLTHQK